MLNKYLGKLGYIPKGIILVMIKGYQIFLSPDQGIFVPRSATCRFYPSCSSYSLQAIKRFGILKGGLLGIKRILKCHPFNSGGWDPVPDRFKF